MSDLLQSVVNGKVTSSTATTSTSTDTSTTGSSDLGKDAFLQLLVAQMKYQDPLNPNTDTAFVAQLATFSQLEQMQNLSQTTTNSQAFGLVGKDVIVKEESTSGGITYKSGTVDYITISGGEAQLCIDGTTYSLDKLYQVIDSTYLIEQGLPTVTKEVKATYDLSDPKDITFEVDLGDGETVATKVAVGIGEDVLDTDYVTLNGTTVTISKEALAEYSAGVYNATVAFNDTLYTTVDDMLTITVQA